MSHRFIPSLPTLDLRVALRRPATPWRRWPGLEHGRVQLFFLARAGVYRAVRHFLAGRSGVVLMPAYHHGVEVEAVRAAGAAVRFYRVGDDLGVDLDDLRAKLQAPDVRVVYLIHYAGVPQPIAEVAALARARGLPLFEDCALSLFSSNAAGVPLGTTGDAACYCLYKTLPVPHGGLLRAPAELADEPGAPPPLLSTLHHAAGLVLADLELRAPGVGRGLRALARGVSRRTLDALVENVRTGTMHLEPRELELGASAVVDYLLARFDPDEVITRRRQNFTRLAAALDGVVPVIGAPLAPGVCPLFLPVRVAEKPRLVSALRARGIDAIDFWSSGDPAAGASAFPEVAQLRRELLELPCHQALDEDDVAAVAEAVRATVRGR